MRGQVESMNEAFTRLGIGLAFAALLVYLLMVVNYQSWLDPFIIICALPGAFCASYGRCSSRRPHSTCPV